MCEYAWTNFEGTSKEFTCRSNEKDRIHPTQKPVALYAWILKNYAHKGDKIFDERCLGEYNTLNGEKWIEQSLF